MNQGQARSVKTMNLQEFIDTGYVQEANRYFFHPMGLSLEPEYFNGVPVSFIVWDFRDDKEGMLYGKKEDNSLRLERTKRIHDLATDRYEDRVKSLGYWIQSPGGEGFKMPHINSNIPIAPGSAAATGIELASYLEETRIGEITNADGEPKQSINGPTASKRAKALPERLETEKPREEQGDTEAGQC